MIRQVTHTSLTVWIRCYAGNANEERENTARLFGLCTLHNVISVFGMAYSEYTNTFFGAPMLMLFYFALHMLVLFCFIHVTCTIAILQYFCSRRDVFTAHMLVLFSLLIQSVTLDWIRSTISSFIESDNPIHYFLINFLINLLSN